MTHFLVLVVVPEDKDLHRVMLPYHEYETTGYRQYVEFVAVKDIKNKAKLANMTVEKYVEENGYQKVGRQWGYYTNPNSKWDWYQVGGRWGHAFNRMIGYKKDMKDVKPDKTGIMPFAAYIDELGVWHEDGAIGWWATQEVNNPEEFNRQFIEWYNQLDPLTMLYMVDCHI